MTKSTEKKATKKQNEQKIMRMKSSMVELRFHRAESPWRFSIDNSRESTDPLDTALHRTIRVEAPCGDSVYFNSLEAEAVAGELLKKAEEAKGDAQ